MTAPLNLFAHMLAEQAVRLDQQHHDEHCEHDRVRQLRGNVRLGENLDDAEQNAADECARNRADAAEYGSGAGALPNRKPRSIVSTISFFWSSKTAPLLCNSSAARSSFTFSSARLTASATCS